MCPRVWVWLLGAVLMTCLCPQAEAAEEQTLPGLVGLAGAPDPSAGGGDVRSESAQPLRALRWGALAAPPASLQASAQAPGWWRPSNPRTALRADSTEGLGIRLVEVAPLADPTRPFQRSPRALEFPAVATTARAQEWGAPLRDCVHRLRLPSRISDAGAVSVQAHWHLRCRF